MASNEPKQDRLDKNKTDLLIKISKEDDYDLSWLKGTAAEKLIELPKPINKQDKPDYSDPVFKKLSKINGKINSMNVPELVKSLDSLSLDSR